MKKIYILFILALLPLTASAFSGTDVVDGIWYVIVTKGRAAEVTCPNGAKYSGDIVIPSTIEYDGVVCNVTTIRKEAFTESKNLNSVVIGDRITSIPEGAFDGCSSLKSVTIPQSVTTIEDYAFSGCSSLTDIVIPDAVTKISYRAFYGCSSLVSVKVPDGVTSISAHAFYGCSNLSSISLPSDLTYIGVNAFHGCSSLLSVVIPSGVTEIVRYTFQGCSGLQSVTIPNSVTTIGEEAFSGCISLTSLVMGGGITSFEKNAFLNCKKVKDIKVVVADLSDFSNNKVIGLIKNNIGGYVKLIDEQGSEIVDYVIPDGVTSIGEFAFYHCNGLTSITIPASVTSIGRFAFWECEKMTAVYISDITAWCAARIDNNPILQARHLYLNGEEVKDLVIPDGVTSIGKWAFEYCEQLTSVSIPSSVKSIGEMAFYNCTSLTSINIPNSVTSIGESAFQKCNSLTTVSVGNKLGGLGYSAFGDCRELTDFYCKTKKPVFASIVFYNSYVEYATLYVPLGSVQQYRDNDNWGKFGHIVALGDVNCDDKVNVADIVAVVNYIKYQSIPAAYDIKRVDMDGNGIIDDSDVSSLVDLIMDWAQE